VCPHLPLDQIPHVVADESVNRFHVHDKVDSGTGTWLREAEFMDLQSSSTSHRRYGLRRCQRQRLSKSPDDVPWLGGQSEALANLPVRGIVRCDEVGRAELVRQRKERGVDSAEVVSWVSLGLLGEGVAWK
jgi:hypothetical protein